MTHIIVFNFNFFQNNNKKKNCTNLKLFTFITDKFLILFNINLVNNEFKLNFSANFLIFLYFL